MDPSRIHAYRTRTTKKHKGQQLLNDVILYSLTTLACTSFCSSPLWYPPFCATFNVFFFLSLPKITSFFFTSKALFIMGNLIVLFLLGESKFFASKSKAYKEVCDDKYKCKRINQIQAISPSQEQTAMRVSVGMFKQEKQTKILGSKPCNEDDQEEFFELCNDVGTCESGVDNMIESFGHKNEDLSCSEDDVVENDVVEEEKDEGMEGDGQVSLPTEELNKLVDDFIARIIRQRMLEA